MSEKDECRNGTRRETDVSRGRGPPYRPQMNRRSRVESAVEESDSSDGPRDALRQRYGTTKGSILNAYLYHLRVTSDIIQDLSVTKSLMVLLGIEDPLYTCVCVECIQ